MRKNTAKKKTLKLVELALLVALVVALQMLSALIPPIGGTVSITLTLIPVVVGGILLGKRAGAILGFFFGAVVLMNCIIALDPGGNLLWNINPWLTAALCLVKGTAAGFVPALLYDMIKGKKKVGKTRTFVATVVAALSAPITNTGIFIAGMLIFFQDTLRAWAGNTDILTYIIVGLVGLNFTVEFIVNIVLSPAVVKIVEVIDKWSSKA